jgi:putative flavoprotein involved in K+ transport
MTIIESGAAFKDLVGPSTAPSPARRTRSSERFDVIVIGAGQAGLSVGHHLARRGLRFVILDESARVGDTWRKRWDSLRLFTPARYAGLDGLPFPAAPFTFPTKDQMADYLEAYARHFELPVRCGVRVLSVTRRGQRYLVRTADNELEADHVIVAMSHFQKPRRPAFAAELAPNVTELHSMEYQNPTQLGVGDVLVVGGGNSGAEIALELARQAPQRRVFLSGRDNGQVPFRIEGFWSRVLLCQLVLRVIFHRLLTIATPLGRKAKGKMLTQGGPLIRLKRQDLAAAGIERVGRMAGVRDGRPLLAGGRVLEVGNVIWCTGFHHGLSWIDLPIFGDDGEPRHTAGVADGEPGLYFVGLMFTYAASSTMIHGVGRDAERVAATIAERRGAMAPQRLTAELA